MSCLWEKITFVHWQESTHEVAKPHNSTHHNYYPHQQKQKLNEH